MTPRATAFTYGGTTASAIAFLLLLLDEPSGRNLTIALVLGLCVGLVTWIRLERR